MIFKGGYDGWIELPIVIHDLISMVLRLLLTCYIFDIKKFIPLKIIILGTFLFMIKFNVFAHPLALDYVEYRRLQESKKIRKQMMGTWNGSVYKFKYEDYKYKREQFPSKITVDSTSVFFEKIPHLQPQYSFIRSYSHYGFLSSSTDSTDWEFVIQKITADSLVFDISNFHNEYLFKLKRKNVHNNKHLAICRISKFVLRS